MSAPRMTPDQKDVLELALQYFQYTLEMHGMLVTDFSMRGRRVTIEWTSQDEPYRLESDQDTQVIDLTDED